MTKIIHISGMSCKHCADHVEKALNAIDGVIKATVDLSADIATVTLKKDIADNVFAEAIISAGYVFKEIE